MIPKTLSATSINVAELCLSRWEAEMFHRGRGIGNVAASIGTAVHGALEMFVKNVILEKKFPDELKVIVDFYAMSYMQTFGSADRDSEEYKDGLALVKAWYKRTDFSEIEVISCEVKESFMIPTSAGEIPFNFIWDRFDKLEESVYRVMDYKTNRWGLNPADLRKKIQARCYALAAQIKYPEAKRIWVEFDMLRHDGPVGVSFSREDNIATWKYLKETAERIIATPEGQAPETLNAECNFCPKKFTCSALKKNVAIGGIFTMKDTSEAVDARAALEYQRAAITRALVEVDEVILAHAKAEDILEFESEMNRLTIAVSSQRKVDAERAEMVLGPELAGEYFGKSLTMGTVDKLLKGDELTDSQKSQLRSLIYKNQGEPRVKIESRSTFGA